MFIITFKHIELCGKDYRSDENQTFLMNLKKTKDFDKITTFSGKIVYSHEKSFPFSFGTACFKFQNVLAFYGKGTHSLLYFELPYYYENILKLIKNNIKNTNASDSDIVGAFLKDVPEYIQRRIHKNFEGVSFGNLSKKNLAIPINSLNESHVVVDFPVLIRTNDHRKHLFVNTDKLLTHVHVVVLIIMISMVLSFLSWIILLREMKTVLKSSGFNFIPSTIFEILIGYVTIHHFIRNETFYIYSIVWLQLFLFGGCKILYEFIGHYFSEKDVTSDILHFDNQSETKLLLILFPFAFSYVISHEITCFNNQEILFFIFLISCYEPSLKSTKKSNNRLYYNILFISSRIVFSFLFLIPNDMFQIYNPIYFMIIIFYLIIQFIIYEKKGFYKEKNIKEMKVFRNDECPICLAHFGDEEGIIMTPCGHFFHDKCVDPWLNIKNSCPICRAPLSSNDCIDLCHDEIEPWAKNLAESCSV